MDGGLQVNEEEALEKMGTAEDLPMCNMPVFPGCELFHPTLLEAAGALADGTFGHPGTPKWGLNSILVQRHLLGSLDAAAIKTLAQVMHAELMLGGRGEPAGKQHGGCPDRLPSSWVLQG